MIVAIQLVSKSYMYVTEADERDLFWPEEKTEF